MILLLLIVMLPAATITDDVNIEKQQSCREESWTTFKKTYNKIYNTTTETSRRNIWCKHILKHGGDKDLTTPSVNTFGDETYEEFNGARLMADADERYDKSSEEQPMELYFQPDSMPESFDWRVGNYITPVVDQGDCSNCWAHAAVAAIETRLPQTPDNPPYTLSAEDLVLCSNKNEDSNICHGGLPKDAFSHVTRNGVAYKNEESDPCSQGDRNKVWIKGYVDLPYGNETILQNAVYNFGPVVTCLHAAEGFKDFLGDGIYRGDDCTANYDPEDDNRDTTYINHCVLLVGYGNIGGVDYWMAKNSWGTDWGDKGYIKLERNRNICHMTADAAYPVYFPYPEENNQETAVSS